MIVVNEEIVGFVGNEVQIVHLGDVRDSFQVLPGIDGPCGIVRGIDHNRFCSFCNRCFYGIQVRLVSAGADEHRYAARQTHLFWETHPTGNRNDDLVACIADGLENRVQCLLRTVENDDVFGVPIAQVGAPSTLYIRKASLWKLILIIMAGVAIIVLVFIANALGLVSC